MRAIAAFELRQQLRSHVFAIVTAISALMVFGSITVDRIRIGPLTEGLRNGSAAIAQVHLVWTLFFMFTATAFVADAVLRDDLTGFGPIVRSAPVRKLDYLLGRFAGAFAATVLCFLSVPAAMALATLAPWIDPATLGPPRPEAYAFALLVLALPNLFLGAATFFALATATRSMMGAYLGAVALLIAYGLGADVVGRATVGPVAALLEPFGFAAWAHALQGWTVAERDASAPRLAGLLLANRVLWIGVGAALLAAACVAFRFESRVPAVKHRPGRIGESDGATVARPPARLPARLPTPARWGWWIAWAQPGARTRLEVRQVLVSPAFTVLLLLGVSNAAGALWSMGDPGAAPVPSTEATIDRLVEAFRLVPITVAIFYAGELVWSERERRVHEIVGSTPVPDWAFLLPKVLAIVVVLVAVLVVAGATAIGVQVLRGVARLEPDRYLFGYLLPQAYDWMLVAILAVFFQAVSPGKLAGWGWTVLYLIVSMALDQLGLQASLYRYGSHADAMRPGAADRGLAGSAAAWRMYWAAFAVLLLTLSHALWGRGMDVRARHRLGRLAHRLRGSAGILCAAAMLAFVVLGLALGQAGRAT